MNESHHAISYVEIQRHGHGPGPRVLRRGVRLGVQRLRPGLLRHPVTGRRGRGRRPRSRPTGRRAGGVLVLLYSLDLDASVRAVTEPPAARSPRSPTSSRAGAGSSSPTRTATCSASTSWPAESPGRPAARPPGTRTATRARRPARPSGAIAAQPSVGVVRRQRAAVVLERQVGDLEGLQPAGGQVGAPIRYAGRGDEPGPVPQVHQPVGDLGAPAGHLEPGQRLGGLQQGGPQLAVRLAHVGELAPLRRHRAPGHRRPHPVRAPGR